MKRNQSYLTNLQNISQEMARIPGVEAKLIGKDWQLLVTKDDTQFFISFKQGCWRIRLPFWGRGTVKDDKIAQQEAFLRQLECDTEERVRIYLADGMWESKKLTCVVYIKDKVLTPRAAIKAMTLAAQTAEKAIHRIIELNQEL